ncbi:unnamed protein product [Spirodela intermedia]|uniref:TFIIS N-terminal domain-containing protein n=1 Tax=Spirodela intermedia TaxID=51605 RepID=A0A7I8IRF3_SPIIN|nr:unnamed protein product [Spirodela intermedia]CAA6660543.1 unnamed protein product [Spirodela intermedia]
MASPAATRPLPTLPPPLPGLQAPPRPRAPNGRRRGKGQLRVTGEEEGRISTGRKGGGGGGGFGYNSIFVVVPYFRGECEGAWRIRSGMDLDDFNAVMRRLDVDLWTLIDTAISVAARDHGKELRSRRDGIVEQLYAPVVPAKSGEKERIQSRGADEKGKLPNEERTQRGSPPVTPSPDSEEDYEEEADEEEEEEAEAEEEDDRDRMRNGRPAEDEESKILAIKEHLDDPDQQSEDSLIQMLQTLADMDIQFKALKATDIGRQVNGLRKHSSTEVRRLVKHLVRKWKDMVDDWVKKNSLETAHPSVIGRLLPSDHPNTRRGERERSSAALRCYLLVLSRNWLKWQMTVTPRSRFKQRSVRIKTR